MKFQSKHKTFHSRKCIWKHRLRSGGHFIQGEMLLLLYHKAPCHKEPGNSLLHHCHRLQKMQRNSSFLFIALNACTKWHVPTRGFAAAKVRKWMGLVAWWIILVLLPWCSPINLKSLDIHMNCNDFTNWWVYPCNDRFSFYANKHYV